MVKVLFVCTGNICRSPTAAGVLRSLAEERGLGGKVVTDSAGTHGSHAGEPPDPRAIEAAARRGVNIARGRARRVSRKDFGKFDLIVAMDHHNHGHLLGLSPEDQAGKLRLFMEFAPEFGIRDVPDPYQGNERDFEHVLDIVEVGARGILSAIERDLD